VLSLVCTVSFALGFDNFRYYSVFVENKFLELRTLFAGLYLLFTIVSARLLYYRVKNKNGGLFIYPEQQTKGYYL